MRYLLAFLVLVPLSVAHAQFLELDGRLTTVCGPTPRVPPLALPPPLNSAGLGLPKQLGGVCTEAIVTADGKGGAVGYWCPQVEPEKARLRLFAVQWDKVTLPMVLDFSQLLLLADKEAKIADIHRKYQSLHIQDMCDIWHPLVDRLNAVYPPPIPLPPPVGTWKATGGTIFLYANGKLTGVTARKAPVGAACDGVTKATVGPTVYQSLAGGPATEVTGCTK